MIQQVLPLPLNWERIAFNMCRHMPGTLYEQAIQSLREKKYIAEERSRGAFCLVAPTGKRVILVKREKHKVFNANGCSLMPALSISKNYVK